MPYSEKDTEKVYTSSTKKTENADSEEEAHQGNQVLGNNVSLDNSNYYSDEGAPRPPTPLDLGDIQHVM